eukprot:CAMPEP_0183732122 /NCGR_PEP_ID=MMETSP0737-20130205/37571_1 /TAXON_ID=385413 /ORGANISM="Thalassiosira miniscula, Strain CCMP1093" /LENGTH=170 /DNA_ID=CAMNT_0025965041 /DNA_START=51 /DNA_END=563 /DNA_ORIENTATION=-
MGKVFFFATLLFTFAEMLNVYQQYFDVDGEAFEGMSPGAFRAYAQLKANTKGDTNDGAPVLRVIEFFGLWVGNSKMIFSMLLLSCAVSSCAQTRVLAAASMMAGCAIYFPRMHPLLAEMEARGEVKENLASGIQDLIGNMFLPMWVFVFSLELHHWLKTETDTVGGNAAK